MDIVKVSIWKMSIFIAIGVLLVFSFLIFYLKKIMAGDTETAMRRLNDAYEEISKKKEELAEKIRQAQEEYEMRKKEADEVASKIKDEAEKEMYEKRDAVIKKAHEDSERMVVEAVGMKDKIREQILKEEKLRSVDACEEILVRVFSGIVREKMNAILISDFLEELKTIDMEHIPPNVEEIEIVTPTPVSEDVSRDIVERIKQRIGRELAYKNSEDESIVGGVQIKFGSLILDGSVAGKIKEKSLEVRKEIEEQANV
ncbi:MAG: F0F1 ATP synthase subunit delta [Candidatus Omnitrophica bacterium]|nr:F0F1 ATP synthase subunit delta [Candidatus Omnitrophota bacterium]MDD5081223.1 F0F1 ATP synthase subunit delta [Candidatus Omnitrophota bacterium]MDD5441551.1 F0F1 ATP synthase subunit delta [Candidatus Omnitrophota bacterium]